MQYKQEGWYTRQIEQNECASSFMEASDKMQYITKLAGANSYHPLRRAKLIVCCLEEYLSDIMNIFSLPGKKRTYDWNLVLSIVDVVEELLLDEGWSFASNDDVTAYDKMIRRTDFWRIIAYAVLENTEEFEYYMTDFWDLLKDIYKESLHFGTHYYHVSHMSRPDLSEPGELVTPLRNLGRISYIIPHLISYAEGWLEYSKKQSDFEPKDFIPLFTFIADTAEEAKLESVRRNDYPDFSKVAEEYRNKVDNILDVQFIIKPPEST